MSILNSLNEEGFVCRFLSNSPAAEMTPEDLKLLTNYIKSIICGRYGYYFCASVIEELTEDAVISAYQSRMSFRKEAKLTSWLYTIIFRTAGRYFKKNYRTENNEQYGQDSENNEESRYFPIVDFFGEEGPDAAIYNPAGEIETNAADFRILLEAAAKSLTAKEALAFQEIVVNENGTDEFAQREGTTVGAVRSLVSDAKKKLRCIFQNEYKWYVTGEDDGRKRRGRAEAGQ